MLIIGCDFHTRYQQIAIVREETGELLIREDAVRLVTHPAIGPLTFLCVRAGHRSDNLLSHAQ